jgi:septin family protein
MVGQNVVNAQEVSEQIAQQAMGRMIMQGVITVDDLKHNDLSSYFAMLVESALSILNPVPVS